ncbi:hypothetical protein RGUI_2772 [Rhodovulum sp. P5]|uniref:hypothetical protein n=1 Tax=Rhodovulum sp. P5 TaxID=1564506 RepID=UPI0009C1E658|nr:hypothetical protein [Rhodovulum sp. P5]ARE40913.1 hypothetical protein RGUI_2772 [Rhodovulum sp. P5]
MKFVLSNTDRYWWPVTVHTPDPESPGAFAEQAFEMQFEARTTDEERAEQDRILGLPDMAAQIRAERASLAAVCTDWRGVVTPDGNPLPFSATNLEAALQKPWVRQGIWNAYFGSLAGEAARLGN